MTIDVEALLGEMFDAGASVIAENGSEISGFAEQELKDVLTAITTIAENVAKNQKDPTTGYPAASGKALLQIQVLALDNVLMGIEDMTRITAQQAINAMLDVVKNVAGGALRALV